MIQRYLPSPDILAAVCILLVLLWWWSTRSKGQRLPPGPTGIPFLGSALLFLDIQSLHIKLMDFVKKYGKIVRLKVGQKQMVLLNSADVIREAFVEKGEYFNERPAHLQWAKKANRHTGIFWNEDWNHIRRFTLVSMRDFGLGKKSLEGRIQEEAVALTGAMEEQGSSPFRLQRLFGKATSNIICSIIVGHRFEYSDPKFDDMVQILESIFSGSTVQSIDNFLPFIDLIPVLRKKTPDALQRFMSLMEIVREWIAEHKETFEADNIRDLIDLFLVEAEKNNVKFDDMSVVQCTLDLFAAGTETTSTTLQWAMLYLSTQQNIQDKCHAEILEVLGDSRLPVWDDYKNLTYIMATLNEAQRVGSIVPLGVWHNTVVDTELSGYHIAKDTIVVANTYASHRDEKVWGDPDVFRPERWIGDDGRLLKNQAYLPFSIGKRACLGEQLAKKELLIFFVSMLQRFRFRLADQQAAPNFKGIMGLTLSPHPYHVQVTRM